MEIVIIVTALVIAYFAVEGIRHGVIRRAVEIVGLVAVFLFASELARGLRPVMSDTFDISDKVAFYAAWVVVLVAGLVGVRLAAAALSKLFRISIIGWLDRVGGLTLGLAFGAVLASCLLIGLTSLPVSKDLKAEVEDHAFTGPLLHVAPTVYDVVRSAEKGERFLDMVRDTVEPMADRASEEIQDIIEDEASQ